MLTANCDNVRAEPGALTAAVDGDGSLQRDDDRPALTVL